MALFDEWAEIDRSHRKLAHRGSRLRLVHVSESSVLRVLAAEGPVLQGNPAREPVPRTPWPDWLEWKPNRICAWDFTHFTRARRAALAILDVVSRKWIHTLVCAEESSTQVEVVFTAALRAEGLLELGDALAPFAGPAATSDRPAADRWRPPASQPKADRRTTRPAPASPPAPSYCSPSESTPAQYAHQARTHQPRSRSGSPAAEPDHHHHAREGPGRTRARTGHGGQPDRQANP